MKQNVRSLSSLLYFLYPINLIQVAVAATWNHSPRLNTRSGRLLLNDLNLRSFKTLFLILIIFKSY